ncbi:TOBE domain-containing protein [Flammeovirga sp. SubArs3]|uniref:TOBE domain-containing protein n=1 Tax=Flammeovirga sp. SubArs3 TaxID=2995316 RepID=UPI00248BE8AA|nr:TOBE domain-containing protein [Flammeovirga sp. SubArs3]
MNKFKGHITEILGDESILLIKVKINSETLSTLTISSTSSPLIIGQEIQIVFKETEVFMGNELLTEQISIQNQLQGTITKIAWGTVLCRVLLETNIGSISSVITTQSAQRLQLQVGGNAVAFIKTNEIILE